ncbi:MAG: PepSY domain-containing protein [Vicinamibacterales bacterium]
MRSAVVVHRWLGVALALVFALWFLSGIVLMYWGFPEVTERDRLSRAPALDPVAIRLSAEQAAASFGDVGFPGDFAREVRLVSADGRPAYDFGASGGRRGSRLLVFADDGSRPAAVDAQAMDRAAAAWAGRPAGDAAKVVLTEVDQWTVGGLRGGLPLLKYSWPDGQQVYVSGRTAEIVQYTTRRSRFWAYLGAIPHWLYFTPLRKHQGEWYSVVVWSSGIGTMAALLGLCIAVAILSPAKRYRHRGRPSVVPYRRWKRWHTIAGLAFGAVTTTWTFSGLLSMGPFPIVDRFNELVFAARDASVPHVRSRIEAVSKDDVEVALRGIEPPPLSAYQVRPPREAVVMLGDFEVKALALTSFDGEPLYVATNGGGETRIVPLHGPVANAIGADRVVSLLRREFGPRLADLTVLEQYDAYYRDRHRARPLPVVLARFNDWDHTRLYVDAGTARLVGSYRGRDWVSRWLYHGLHSLDVPWLYNHRPLWDIVVLALMLGGTALCATSLVLAWQVVLRKTVRLTQLRMRRARVR